MPIENYGVLACRAVEGRFDQNTNDHYQVHVTDGTTDFRIAINVKSQEKPPAPTDLRYYADDNFRHPLTDGLGALALGFHALPSKPGGLALDYIRANLFDLSRMRVLPETAPPPHNSITGLVDGYIKRAIDEKDAVVYAFGSQWSKVDPRDKYFDFGPGYGIHDIHMNQGDRDPQFMSQNGVWQDGGLIIHYPTENRWIALYLAFQSQADHTDDTTGNPLDTPTPPPTPQDTLRIVSALVKPGGDDVGHEVVTLYNGNDAAVDLTGWQIADSHKLKDTISGVLLEPTHTVRIRLSGHGAQLSNKGGIITLLDPSGLKVDGVAYTAEQAGREGKLINF